jgi:hypothetical protein
VVANISSFMPIFNTSKTLLESYHLNFLSLCGVKNNSGVLSVPRILTSVEFPTSTYRNTELFGLDNLKAYRNGKSQTYLRILALFIVRL